MASRVRTIRSNNLPAGGTCLGGSPPCSNEGQLAGPLWPLRVAIAVVAVGDVEQVSYKDVRSRADCRGSSRETLDARKSLDVGRTVERGVLGPIRQSGKDDAFPPGRGIGGDRLGRQRQIPIRSRPRDAAEDQIQRPRKRVGENRSGTHDAATLEGPRPRGKPRSRFARLPLEKHRLSSSPRLGPMPRRPSSRMC